MQKKVTERERDGTGRIDAAMRGAGGVRRNPAVVGELVTAHISFETI